ncbi:hypothetical protein Trydic_g4529 [Trypoxylus dichotomus]
MLQEVNVELKWTGTHVGTEGNEKADELAEEGGADDGAAYTFASKKSVQSTIAMETQREWQERWKNAVKGRRTKRFIGNPNEFHKLEITLPYQATPKHGNFGAYLHRIGRRVKANGKCGEEDTAGHILFDCLYMDMCRARMETTVTNADLRWPRNELKISDNQTAE